MSKLLIDGSHKLEGVVNVHGAKNSALPILAATILCTGKCILHNCPHLSDVDASIKILRFLGVKIRRENNSLEVDSSDLFCYDIPDTLMREMRSSIVFLGALLSRIGRAKLSFPGGCELGPRPIDLHLKAFKQLGVTVSEDHGLIECVAQDGIVGSHISLSFPSVGATENILLASVMCKGATVINNAAREPEICDLVDFLNACGARIYGAGEGVIVIEGVKSLSQCEHKIIPDRISASTFMAAAAITLGDVTVNKIIPNHLSSIIPIFEEAGCKVCVYEDSVRIIAPDNRLYPIKEVRTMPYPGFPTDAQAIIMAMSTVSNGTSVFIENIFECRYKHVGELIRLGAKIKVESRVAVVEGIEHLSGAYVKAFDLRGAASLVIAGLASEGRTCVVGLNHLDRGYEKLEKSLETLGAIIKRV